jgi:hypothetical protein
MTALAKIRVAEKHGIRRFLYPLKASVQLPDDYLAGRLALRTPSGDTVPAYIDDDPTSARLSRIDFAVSLAPFDTLDLELVDGEPMRTPDPMSHRRSGGGGVETNQERLGVVVDDNALLARVVYDGIDHLRAPLSMRLNGQRYSENNNRLLFSKASEIAASICTGGIYGSEAPAATVAWTTACKSWITQEHRPRVIAGDRVSFELPFAVDSPTLLCDFGLGGGIYTKFVRESTEEVSAIVDADLNWTLNNGPRADYAGVMPRIPDPDRPDYHGLDPLWFHVVDGTKAIAVAITWAPVDTAEIAIRIRNTGDIAIDFVPGADHPDGAPYAVCYHFLNDVPAIAAATCPQSIMLPPSVEVV